MISLGICNSRPRWCCADDDDWLWHLKCAFVAVESVCKQRRLDFRASKCVGLVYMAMTYPTLDLQFLSPEIEFSFDTTNYKSKDHAKNANVKIVNPTVFIFLWLTLCGFVIPWGLVAT